MPKRPHVLQALGRRGHLQGQVSKMGVALRMA